MRTLHAMGYSWYHLKGVYYGKYFPMVQNNLGLSSCTENIICVTLASYFVVGLNYYLVYTYFFLDFTFVPPPQFLRAWRVPLRDLSSGTSI